MGRGAQNLEKKEVERLKVRRQTLTNIRNLLQYVIRHDDDLNVGVEEDEPFLEEAWPHLHIIYELLYRFVLSKEVDAKNAKDYFSKRFILQLLNLFDSDDPRERDYLKVRTLALYL